MDGAALAGVEPNKGLEELAPQGRVNGLAAAGVPDDCDSEVLAPPKERPVFMGIGGVGELKELYPNEEDEAPKGLENGFAGLWAGTGSDHREPSLPPKDSVGGGSYERIGGVECRDVTDGDENNDIGGGENVFAGEGEV